MNIDKGPIQALKEWFSKERPNPPPGKKGKKYQYVLIVLLLGVAFMLMSDLWVPKNDAVEVSSSPEEVPAFGSKESDTEQLMKEYEEHYKNQLKEALDQIVGVSEAHVVVNVEATESKVFEKNATQSNQKTDEVDKQGGERSIQESNKEEQIVIIRDGEKEVPIIKETKKPKVSGVLVVAKGADNIQLKKWIIEAVTRTLDVPSHRVSVLPKK
ncbi:stage III sporulation protein AG [Rossellomorea marisflavi]|uniref:stage III sporulation protein AG n=1 Tax=Rossellomorea marisflavi TaxID=189381 RepID=UPI001EE27CE5|nr:stage III sporulation protein AG [Rossellomorea marisflavi]UKS63977.1 stage III sporulation protein AG [Rossellomorea marisflavi]